MNNIYLFISVDLHMFYEKVCGLGGYEGCVSKKVNISLGTDFKNKLPIGAKTLANKETERQSSIMIDKETDKQKKKTQLKSAVLHNIYILNIRRRL